MLDRAWIKLAILANGLTTDAAFDSWFARNCSYVRRRNFYNSPNWDTHRLAPLPQEVRLTGSIPVTVAVNAYGPSPWRLTWSEQTGPMISGDYLPGGHPTEMLTDLSATGEDDELARVCNLYGGSALSFFSPRACYFFADGTACRFCSLDGTARENDEFAGRLTPAQVRDAVTKVVTTDGAKINQVMIVGGNDRSFDRGFRGQVALAQAASESLNTLGLATQISVHLVAMPPIDLGLIDLLADIPNVHAGFNLEVWDSDRFALIAPGKAVDYGHATILRALRRLRDAVGPYHAHSILIAGLEPPNSTLAGARALAEEGISPVINAYHSDRHSAIGLSIRPSYRQLVDVASGLQELYDCFPILPYWKGCGRNALDFEASHGMFRTPPPNYR